MYSIAVIFVILSVLTFTCCNSTIYGASNAASVARSYGRISYTNSGTLTIDNPEFSRALGFSLFRNFDESKVNGSSISAASAQRGTAPNNITSRADGFANSFVIASNPQSTGITASGASLIDTFALYDSAGLNGSAAVEANVNGSGYIAFQNQAGGTASTRFGDAIYNYTSRFNVSQEDATVADFVNVLLVSNENQTGSSLTLCQGSVANCSVFTPGL